MRRAGLLALLLLLSFIPARASAHQASVTYSTVTVGDDGVVDYLLLLSSRDLFEALGLTENRDATDEEILTGGPRLLAYVGERVLVADGDTPCPLELVKLDVVTQADRFARLALRARCGGPIGVLVLDYALFFDLDGAHVGMLHVSYGGHTVKRELSAAASRFEWTLAGPPPDSEGFVDFIEHGVEHIFTGYDHIAFLIGLLLVAAIARDEQRYRARSVRDGLVAVLKTVTAFTVAHSLTLIAAGLGWIELPSRLVESAIAASIVYVAAENVLLPMPRARWPLAFGFGLVHGLGFASMLRPILPASDVVVPLLAFNVGVELGQLAIVALLYPALAIAAQRGADGYRRVVVVGGSVIVGGFGLLWLIERVFGVMTISRVLS